MLLNISNHPYSSWSVDQIEAAAEYGEVVDIPFPDIDPYADEGQIAYLADSYMDIVLRYGAPDEVTVHLMGEFCFTYTMLATLKSRGYTCIASTSRRRVVFEDDVKKVYFDFCTFRRYWID